MSESIFPSGEFLLTARIPSRIDDGGRLWISKSLVCYLSIGNGLSRLKLPISKAICLDTSHAGMLISLIYSYKTAFAGRIKITLM